MALLTGPQQVAVCQLLLRLPAEARAELFGSRLDKQLSEPVKVCLSI